MDKRSVKKRTTHKTHEPIRTTPSRLGYEAETCALNYLKAKGYQCKARNYRYKKGEIDLIMRAGPKLIFVEVKARSHTAFGHPEQTIDDNKRNRIIDTAQYYVEKYKWKGDIRFDIVAIDQHNRCTHIRDAFY